MEDDAVVVKLIRAAGAVPFVRRCVNTKTLSRYVQVITNVPQTLFSYCPGNPIYGNTTHPTHRTRGPGGSSSGEGVMCRLKGRLFSILSPLKVARTGSVFGIGNDIGGSVRIPALWSGGYAFKGTHTRSTLVELCISR